MIFIKKFFWIPLVLILFVALSKKSRDKKKSFTVTDFNLRPYNSSVSLDKKQMLLMKEIEFLKRKMLKRNIDTQSNNTLINRNNKDNKTNKFSNFPVNHIVLPDGSVISPISSSLLVKEAISKSGKKFYYNSSGDLIEENISGEITNHGKQKLKVLGDNIYIGEKKVSELKSYSTKYAVDADGEAYMDRDGEMLYKNRNGKSRIIGRNGKISVYGKDVILKASGLSLKKTNIDSIVTEAGSKIYINEKGEVIEDKKNGTTINHGAGRLKISKDGKIIMVNEAGEEKLFGNVKATKKGIITDNGSKIYKNKKGEVIEIRKDGLVINHGTGEIIKNKNGSVSIKNEAGKVSEIGIFKEEFKFITNDNSDIIFSKDGVSVVSNGKVSTGETLELTNENVDNIRKNNTLTLKSKDINKFLTISRRLTTGEIVYTVSGNTYFVIDDGKVIKVDRAKNLETFLGALFVKNAWLYIFKSDGIRTEKILRQLLKNETILNTTKNTRFIKRDDKVFEEKNNKLSSLTSFKIDGNKVYANGRYAGDVKSTQGIEKIGTDKEYRLTVNKKKFISASLLGKDKINISVGNKNITATVKEKISTTKNSIQTRFNLLKKKLSLKNKKEANVQVVQTVVAPVSDGEIVFYDEDLETSGFEGEDYFTIPMLTLIVADMRFGAIAPTEDSSKEKVSFNLKKNVVLKNGQIIPLKGGGVRGTVQGEYNSERGIFETDKVIFYGPETDSYYEGELKTRVISAEDYINGLEGDVISKQDKVMLEILQGELIGGFSDFVATANNPLSAISGQQNFQMSDVLAGSALSGIGKSGKKYVDFKIENAKKLLPVIALHPGRLVILEVWETTKVRKI